MSDNKLRKLERKVKSEPNDYIAWGQYLQEGARLKRFDPHDTASLITWLYGINRVIPFYNLPTHRKSPRNLHRNHKLMTNWYKAEHDVGLLLHNIRNAHGQWSAERFKTHIDNIFPRILRKTPAGKPAFEVEVISQEDQDIPYNVCWINKGIYITYEETGLHNEKRTPPHEQSLSYVRFTRIPTRSLVEFGPQYLLQLEVTFSNPPDGDIVTRFVSGNPHEICFELIKMEIENNSQELADIEYAESMHEDEYY